MSRSSALTCLLLAGLSLLAIPARARGQGWSIDVSAGRLVYDPVSVNVGTSNVMGTLRYDSLRGVWVYGTAAAPMRNGDPVWGAFGTGGRFLPSGSENRRVAVGADLDAHGFLFRDDVAVQTGRGATVEAIPFASLAAGTGRIELRGGWRGHTLALAGVTENRGVFETGARGGYGTTVRVEGDMRWVHASEGTYPFAGATVAYDASPVQVWGQLGKWLATDLDDRVWALGSGVSLGVRTTVWGSVRQEAPDPLYWNSSRRTWSVGLTQRLGRIPAPLAPVSASPAGTVIVRLPAADAPAGAVSIAGDFNNWQPAPMQREGSQWIVRLPLGPGVYHYTFRSTNGDWFVPPSTAGRRDDGMGGYVAVLVVS